MGGSAAVTVQCAAPKYQGTRKFTRYRVEYEIGRPYGFANTEWDPTWGTGTLTAPMEVQQNFPNKSGLYGVQSMPANGKDQVMHFAHLKSPSFPQPKLTLRIVPVTTDCKNADRRNPVPSTAGCDD